MQICEFAAADLESVVQLSLRAWEPVFDSIKQSLPPEVYHYFYPDWREAQRAAVAAVCTDPQSQVWVAKIDESVAGFVALQLRSPTFGEIHMIAVDPTYQRRQVGAALTDYAINWLREHGVVVAMVETGGDPGHAPARQLYEAMGFQLWPVARYFRHLQ